MPSAPLNVSVAPDGTLATDYGIAELPGAPWPFKRLAEPHLTNTLERFANAESSIVSGVRVDSVWFQPAQGEERRSQDRIYAGPCSVNEQTWSLFCVFDGHAGEECAEHALKHFPKHLEKALSGCSPDDVDSILRESFISFDNHILEQVRAIFPDPHALASVPVDDLNARINDHGSGGTNYGKIRLAMRGTTALVSLVDEARQNMWIAGIGDCRAILGVQLDNGQWEAHDIIAPHNGSNKQELQKVADAHPGEPDVTLRNRVLGAIAVTRAWGDAAFKLPADYTWNVFLRANPGFRVHSSVEDFTKRNLTPPYMTAIPDIVHIRLDDTLASGKTPKFVILTSDGSVDEHVLTLLGRTEAESFQKWVELVGAQLDAEGSIETKRGTKPDNLALRVLREAFGGSNEELLSIFLTLDMQDKWVDDASVQVLVL